MKKILLLIGFVFWTVSIFAQECFMTLTETRYWDESKAYNGYTLFGTRGVTYLIDMAGHVVHTWPIGTNPRLTEAGTLLDAVGGNPSNSNVWKELDWNGNVVWQYTETRSGYYPHHDFEKIYNKKLSDSTFIYIANKDLTSAQCIAAGCNPSNNYTGAQMDVIVEVNKSGTVIWEWSFFDHVVQDIDATKSTYGAIKDNPGKINLNLRGNPVKSDWLHCNSLDYNQDLDLIVINSVHGEFYVIDHGNTFVANDPTSSKALAASSAGDFLYRFGDPAKYNQGDPPSVLDNWEKATAGHKQIGGAHNIQWIKPGLPGAGHFLIFNNAENLFELTPQSYIFEINPYLNSAGITTSQFVNPPTAGYIIKNSPNSNLMKEKKNVSKQIVWSYSSKNNTSFYSTIGSSAQRLPNGNTLVCSMNDGHFFEVSPSDTSIVWEYINPMTRDGIKRIKVDNYPTYNGVFRAYRYSKDHPALVGHDLTPGDAITGFDPDYYTPETITSTKNNEEYLQPSSVLNQNYPNPFTYSTTIDFEIDKRRSVNVVIFDLSGRQIKTLVDKNLLAGNYSLSWDGTNDNGSHVVSGIYFYILRADNQKISKKMIYNR
ncbi:MAG: aryl-sulfate sulfotransferase [Bacteroidales bacterium]|nr:aryl-sulfate sulfotransferase [Bacteroidales bacterium]